MDLHKPKPVHSLREFLAELGTIVLGIVIALALEAAVEASHNATLVERSRADFREELQLNRQKVAADLDRDQKLRTVFQELIGFTEARLRHQASPSPLTQSFSRTFIHLSETAWRTALSTQVMVHFPHDEARRISEAYSEQETFSAVERAAESDWFELASFDLSGNNQTEDDLRAADKRLRVSFAYLISLQGAEQRLLGAYDAALAPPR